MGAFVLTLKPPQHCLALQLMGFILVLEHVLLSWCWRSLCTCLCGSSLPGHACLAFVCAWSCSSVLICAHLCFDGSVVNIPIYSPFPLLLSIVSITFLIYFRSIYLKHTILEVMDIFYIFPIKNTLYLSIGTLGTCSERVANMFQHIRKFLL